MRTVMTEEPQPPVGLEEEWAEFLEHRKLTKAKYPTPFAQKILLKRLSEYSNGNLEIARRIIENSIIGGKDGPYEKFWPLRDDYRQIQPKRYEVSI